MEIDSLHLSTVYDSRAQPTVQATVNDTVAAAPSGASTGRREAHNHIPDDLPGVENELQNIFTGEEWTPSEVDAELRRIDGTDTFETLGRVSTAVSLAAWNAAGFQYSPTVPYPLGNVVGGGMHGGSTAIQEFLVLPVEAETFPEAVKTNAAIYHEIRDRYPQRIRGVNDESAHVLDMDTYETLDMLHKLCEEYGARIGLDVAANSFYENGTYHYPALELELDAKQQRKFVLKLIEEYDLVYVEDPFHEDDMDAFTALREDVTRNEYNCWIVGDDLTVTQSQYISEAAETGAITGCILKPNQVGTVSATRDAFNTCSDHGVLPVISHRSGETTDSTIADLAVAWNIPVIKAGVAGIRIAKLNRLLTLWHQVQSPELPDLAAYY